MHAGTLLGEGCVVAADDTGELWVYRANCTSPPTVVTVGSSTWGVSVAGNTIVASANSKLVVVFRWGSWPLNRELLIGLGDAGGCREMLGSSLCALRLFIKH